MGITGLLPCLKTHQQSKHLSALKGKTVGVDSYAWLHKGRLDV
jgi:exonuclease-1